MVSRLECILEFILSRSRSWSRDLKKGLDNNAEYYTLLTAGSPFTVKVNGPPDPSKVRVSGPGIHNGVLQQYDGSFTVNTLGAGPGELTVKIRGPKGLYSVLYSALNTVFMPRI